MAERFQPTRDAKENMNEEKDSSEDIQDKLRELLGSDSDDDMDYTPHLVECELSESDDDKDKKKVKKITVDVLEDVAARSDNKDKKKTIPLLKDIEDSSDESIVLKNTVPVNTKAKVPRLKRKFNKKKPCGGGDTEVFIRDLYTMPTELKKSMDRLYLQKDWKKDGALICKKGMRVAIKDQVLQELHRQVSQEDPETACDLLLEVMTKPKTFWYNARFIFNYDVEEVGLACIQLLERIIVSKTLFLEVILKVGKISSKWRFKEAVKESNKIAFIPKTMTRCARILLEEGDVKGLEELFDDYRSNLKNVEGEKELVLYRCVSAMLEKKRFDEGSDVLSLGGTSLGTSFKSVGLPPDTIISEVQVSLRNKREVDWLMPFFSWYVMDEKSADDVKDILTEYRNENMEHLPAHQHLIEFLFQEYEEETEILLEELTLFCKQFPWDKTVLTYCQLLIKKVEDDDLEDSFNSDDDEEGGENSSNDKDEIHRTVFDITVNFLDYEMNRDCAVCWDLLSKSLKKLCTSAKELSYMAAYPWIADTFSDRGGWWVQQNFQHSPRDQDTALLVKKAFVMACLYGTNNKNYLEILSVLQQTMQSFPSTTLNSLLKELQVSVDALGSPCLEPFREDFSRVDRNWNKREWVKIKHIEKFVKEKRNKSYYSLYFNL